MENEHWKEIMFDAITASYFDKTIKLVEAGRLRLSIKKDIDELGMYVDTQRRLGKMK